MHKSQKVLLLLTSLSIYSALLPTDAPGAESSDSQRQQQPPSPVDDAKPSAQQTLADTSRSNSTETGSARDFYQVLDDVLGDFEYDIKNGNVKGLKDLAVRNLALSENVPTSFKAHLDLLITEMILKNTTVKVIQCLPCRAKRASIEGDHITIHSLDSNPDELSRVAKSAGILRFLDVAFSFEPSGMILSLYITDPDTNSILWSRSYNSETSRAAAFRRGVDYDQMDQAHRATEYAPQTQSRLILYYLQEPNNPNSTGCLALGYRMMERYDNRKKEVGFELEYITNASSIVYPAGNLPTDLYTFGGLNLTLLFMHAWNLIGEEENYNLVRGGIFVGIGGTYANSFLGGLVRGGYEWRLGKHFGAAVNLGYRPLATSFLGTQTTVSGLEYGLGVSILF